MANPGVKWPDYSEGTGFTVRVEDGGAFAGDTPKAASTKSITNQLYELMGWPTGVRFSPDFPLEITAVDYTLDLANNKAVVRVAYRFRDGTEGYLEDDADQYPSDTLRAALVMMTGNVGRLRAQHRKEVAKRVAREAARNKRSNRPW